MIILAMTSLSGQVGIISSALCLGLMVHAVFPCTLIDREKVVPSRLSIWLRFLLEAAATYLWLAVMLPLLAWAFWIGDNDHWFFHRAWIFAGLISATIFGFAAWRNSRRGATRGYLAWHLWGSIALLSAYGFTIGYETLHRIEGFTAESAAQRVFHRLTKDSSESVTMVQYSGPKTYGRDPDDYRVYWIMGKSKPRGRFAIGRHQSFGWTFASSEQFLPSADELKRVKERMAGSND